MNTADPKKRPAKGSDPIDPGATEAEETEPKTGAETEVQEAPDAPDQVEIERETQRHRRARPEPAL
ncbi:MAG: hypothetical protein ACHQ51_11895 [Elusimicrobiota bacterium]